MQDDQTNTTTQDEQTQATEPVSAVSEQISDDSRLPAEEQDAKAIEAGAGKASEESIQAEETTEPEKDGPSPKQPEDAQDQGDSEEAQEPTIYEAEGGQPEETQTADLKENEPVKAEGEEEEEAVERETESTARKPVIADTDDPNAKWYVIHTFAGHENKVLATLKQRVEAEHLENKIFDILVPTQDKIEIRGGKKETVKEKIFPGYILVKMILDDITWLTVRTTQGVTSFIGAGSKPIPISEAEVNSIVKFTTQGAAPTFKDVFLVDDTVKIIDGPFADFIGKVESVDKEKGRVRVLVSIFGRETPVELDFLQVQKL